MSQITRVTSGIDLRINAKQFHLTYAACYSDELDLQMFRERADDWARSFGGLKEWVIARELHAEPEDPDRDTHYHLYMHFHKRKDITNRLTTKEFDVMTRTSNMRHPEIQSVGRSALDREKVIRYDLKDGDYICSPGLDDEFPNDSPPEDWATQLNREPTVQSGMAMLSAHYPQLFYTKGPTIKAMLAEKIGRAQTQLFQLSDFTMQPLPLEDGPIVLHGTSNAGKTAFAMAHFEHPLVVKHRDDLKNISPTTDGLIFDDMTFTDWSPEEAIALLDFELTRSISCRYAVATIEADTPIIFTTNKRMDDHESIFPRPPNSEQCVAITRRFEAIKVTGPLQKGGGPMSKAEKRKRREEQHATQQAQVAAAIDAAKTPQAPIQDDSAANSPAPPPARRRRQSILCSPDSPPTTCGSIQVQSDELHVHMHN